MGLKTTLEVCRQPAEMLGRASRKLVEMVWIPLPWVCSHREPSPLQFYLSVRSSDQADQVLGPVAPRAEAQSDFHSFRASTKCFEGGLPDGCLQHALNIQTRFCPSLLVCLLDTEISVGFLPKMLNSVAFRPFILIQSLTGQGWRRAFGNKADFLAGSFAG